MYKVVVQLSGDDPEVQKSVIAQIKNLINALPGVQIELVIHSKGIEFIRKNSKWERELGVLKKAQHLKILACNNTLNSFHLTPEDLIPLVDTVPSAVAHIVVRQHEGWSYLKAGH